MKRRESGLGVDERVEVRRERIVRRRVVVRGIMVVGW